MRDVLIAIISGKRPGDKEARPTEKYKTQLDRVIISNDAEGYVTEIPIVLVPDDYREWYVANHKNSDGAWYAPMNRSYAIKYAREHGYRYLVQMDDNIVNLSIDYWAEDGELEGVFRRYRQGRIDAVDDFCAMFRVTLQNTNAAYCGCQVVGPAPPGEILLREGYVYSFFMLDLERCPDVWQGDFEDDIEYRLKCAQMGRPVAMIPWLGYGKVSQRKTGDKTGCRAEYVKQGINRGAHMSVLYGDQYKCKMTNRSRSVMPPILDTPQFMHTMTPFRVGIIVSDMDAIRAQARATFAKWKKPIQDKAILKTKRRRG